MNRAPQYDLEGGGFENVFNLRVEETQDGERLRREQEERECAKAEAAQRETKEQPCLL
jgi:hypothetical protein